MYDGAIGSDAEGDDDGDDDVEDNEAESAECSGALLVVKLAVFVVLIWAELFCVYVVSAVAFELVAVLVLIFGSVAFELVAVLVLVLGSVAFELVAVVVLVLMVMVELCLFEEVVSVLLCVMFVGLSEWCGVKVMIEVVGDLIIFVVIGIEWILCLVLVVSVLCV